MFESKDCYFETHRSHCVVSLSKTFILCLVLVQPRKTRKSPDMTEKLLVVSVAEQAGLSLAMSETPKTGFLALRLKCMFLITFGP